MSTTVTSNGPIFDVLVVADQRTVLPAEVPRIDALLKARRAELINVHPWRGEGAIRGMTFSAPEAVGRQITKLIEKR